MDVREKLVKQAISHFWYGVSHDIFSEPVTTYAKLAIEALEKEKESGVTVQEWISVDDRLPDPFVPVLVQMPGEEPFPTVREGFISNDGVWQSAMFRRELGEVTHWQPMPQPPKGE